MASDYKCVKVPVILQMEELECGAASLAMVLAYYKKWVPLEQVRTACGISRDGCNAWNILEAAKTYGLEGKGFRYNLKRLQEKASFPCIVFWNMTHFIVLDGFKGNKVYINDPAQGKIRMPAEEFERGYSGICLTFEPGEAFVADGRKASTLEFLKKGMNGNTSTLALVMLTGALAMLAGCVIPVFTRVYTDEILPGNADSWYYGFIILFAGVILFQLAASVINLVYVTRAVGKLSVTSNVSFMHHIFRMPMEFFSQRMAGDLAQRAVSNDAVAQTLVGQVAPLIMNMVLVVFYLFVMIEYSVPLTIIGLITIVLNLFLARIISNKRMEISRIQMRDQGKLQAVSASGIGMVETIKASGAEEGFLERWSGYHASMIKAKVRFDGINRFLGTLPSLVIQLSGIAIMIMAFYSIMTGHFTAGLFLAFQACMNAFTVPASQLISAGQSIQEMRSSIERISDVLDYPEDINANEEYDPEEMADARKLSGNIEINNVTFGYARLGEPVIKDFSLSVKAGQRIAFVGSSGCGKSTIAKLLTGLYKPWNGEILFDGKPISEIPKPIFYGSLAMVDQEVVLFRDTIANNIRMWDKSIEDYDMILAARDADIHSEIMAGKGGYQHELEENGHDLSGGQRQRIEIARVLAVDPSIIILDEATSALDARTEYDISRYIHDRGITNIIIAHRLSTIRDCDEIIVLDHGEVVQRGKHRELMQEEGLYRELIIAQ